MHTNDYDTSVHSGNYYFTGADRVLVKLAEFGISVPKKALEIEYAPDGSEYLGNFTYYIRALVDWFDGRDYNQAQDLIHFAPASNNYHLIELLNANVCPGDLSYDMLCPSAADAIAAVIRAADDDGARIDAFRKVGDDIVAVFGGRDALKITPIVYEPFDLAIRDRVRTALKGVRQYEIAKLADKASQLPGLDNLRLGATARYGMLGAGPGAMLLGFPANWARAMRGALGQVGIEVKQNQAQELVAVFFGASNWHQLVKHQHELNDGLQPVAVTVKSGAGRVRRFYHTTEEALFAAGKFLRTHPKDLVADVCELSMDMKRICLTATTQEARNAVGPGEIAETVLDCGENDYWSVEFDGEESHLEAAQAILRDIGSADKMGAEIGDLYASPNTLGTLAGILQREGQSPDQAVQLDQHAVALFYSPDRNGSGLETALARIYQLAHGGLHKVATVAMYKADMEIRGVPGAQKLVIVPDYGKGQPIEMPYSDPAQVFKLMALTGRKQILPLTEPVVLH